jgi:hypothetical protein
VRPDQVEPLTVDDLGGLEVLSVPVRLGQQPHRATDRLWAVGLLSGRHGTLGHAPQQIGGGLIGEVELGEVVDAGERRLGTPPVVASVGTGGMLRITNQARQQGAEDGPMIWRRVTGAPCRRDSALQVIESRRRPIGDDQTVDGIPYGR